MRECEDFVGEWKNLLTELSQRLFTIIINIIILGVCFVVKKDTLRSALNHTDLDHFTPSKESTSFCCFESMWCLTLLKEER